MKSIIQILILFILISCNSNPKRTELHKDVTDNSDKEIIDTTPQTSEISANVQVVERHFPKELIKNQNDTLINDLDLEITITKSALDSYVTNEYEVEGIKHIDKYRDFNYHLVITKTDDIILDTVFIKEDFLEYTGQDFLDISNFHDYWFNKIEEDLIEFFAVINKPETDWSFAFYHNYSLTTGKFEIVEFVDEEI